MPKTTTDAVDLVAGEGRSSRTQIAVAAIGALAVIMGSVVTGILPKLWPDQGGGTTPVPHLDSPNGAGLSAAAARLINDKYRKCDGPGPDAPSKKDIAITSPTPGADVDGVVAVQGTVNLGPGEHLYLFSYATGDCHYYFNPPRPLHVENGAWTQDPDVSSAPDAKVPLIAAVVDEETDGLFNEITSKRSGAAYIVGLSTNVKTAQVTVHVRPGVTPSTTGGCATATHQVPDVVGHLTSTLAEAKLTLFDSGGWSNVKVQEQPDAEHRGLVLHQEPQPGKLSCPTDVITLTVAS
jgi:PASTA domain